ncbi:hypothetical protein PIB30_044218 [Stylosanthes scabra]|uniref:F-box domain-containing protein n=1 Tax=Stylosanthes scabra TaxID=79078 RepID=A0ABU6UF30_9FABA|nr:hypothetical protein [Stylosanthes scabra]
MAEQDDVGDPPPQWNLPNDLIVEILCRTDPSTIGKCRTLSRQWNDLLTNFDFLHRSYNFNKEKQLSICIHVFFPNWNCNRHSLIRVDSKRGNRLYCTLPPQLQYCQNLDIVGIENGIICLTYNMEHGTKQILAWNMLTQTSRRIPEPEYFHCSSRCHNLFAFTYIPQSTTYCIMHDFKLNLHDPVIFYTVYSSATRAWSQHSTLEGNPLRLGPQYLSMTGTISWLNYNGPDNSFPDLLITYSVVDDSWTSIGILARWRAGSHKLLNFTGKLSVASYPTAPTNQYMVVVRSLIQRRDGSQKWIAQLKLDGLKRYEQPKFFIDEDLITLTDEAAQNGIGTRQILLSRIREPEDYLWHHLQCGAWSANINIQSIDEYSPALFPIVSYALGANITLQLEAMESDAAKNARMFRYHTLRARKRNHPSVDARGLAVM